MSESSWVYWFVFVYIYINIYINSGFSFLIPSQYINVNTKQNQERWDSKWIQEHKLIHNSRAWNPTFDLFFFWLIISSYRKMMSSNLIEASAGITPYSPWLGVGFEAHISWAKEACCSPTPSPPFCSPESSPAEQVWWRWSFRTRDRSSFLLVYARTPAPHHTQIFC